MPKKEESLIDEMRAAIAHDREHLARRPVATFEVSEKQPEREPEPEPARRSLLARVLRRR